MNISKLKVEEWKLFHAPIGFVTLDDIDNDAIVDYCLNYRKNNPSRTVSNKGGYQSSDLSGYVPVLNEVFKYVVTFSNEKFSKNGKTDKYTTNLGSSWININQKFSYNDVHDHTRCFYSFVYYAKVPENSGNLRFHHPCPTFQHVWDPMYFNSTSEIEDSHSYEVWRKPTEKLLVMFPPWLKHSVSMNESEDERISIALNTFIEHK